MTLFDAGPQPKQCFVYCGDDRCDCEGAPRYRRYGIDHGRPGRDKTMMAEVERQPDGTIKVLSIGEVIEGEIVSTSNEAETDLNDALDDGQR